jgi:hypothetical protein
VVPPDPADPDVLAGSPPDDGEPADPALGVGGADAGADGVAAAGATSGATTRPVPAVAVTVTAVPLAISIDAVALNSWV